MTRFSLFSDTIPVGNNICSIIQYIQVSESFTRFDISCTHKGCSVFMRHNIIVLPYFLASSTDLVFAFCFRGLANIANPFHIGFSLYECKIPVSYTHLDVYKRQYIYYINIHMHDPLLQYEQIEHTHTKKTPIKTHIFR